jgi:hypothetical protein
VASPYSAPRVFIEIYGTNVPSKLSAANDRRPLWHEREQFTAMSGKEFQYNLTDFP